MEKTLDSVIFLLVHLFLKVKQINHFKICMTTKTKIKKNDSIIFDIKKTLSGLKLAGLNLAVRFTFHFEETKNTTLKS